MLDVRRLALLRELHVRGTIASVAAALHQSPSSVSQQLATLEREAGAPLLRKVGRRVQLTPQAELLVEHAAAILERLELAESELQTSLGEATGTVRLAIFQSAALALMPAMLETLRAEHPRLRVTISQREPESALLETYAREFDLVVAEQYPSHAAPWHPELDRVPLTGDAIRLAVAPDRTDITRLEDTTDLPWVAEPRGTASRHFAEQACRQAGFEPDIRFETADLQAHVALIRSGNAVALMPDLMWRGEAAPVRLVPLPGSPVRTVFTAARRSSSRRPSILAVRDALERAGRDRSASPG
ncbi:LysR substrate-binding domain-containing protein [Nocardioides sp. SYSU D00038]|uniref:LysR substrate-binding domain-containing protein n=1 Tax=Nocardioides sp. SYSU D00038 TaxID=2812554 RepID=UPI001967C7C5|nr:LysR substrate-binding domain-containing protein [Nocardioides sp. SYSU D00038]